MSSNAFEPHPPSATASSDLAASGTPTLACDAGALDPATRAAHFTWIRQELPSLIQAAHELPNGLALELPVEALAAVADFIDRERRCCPFLRFELHVAPAGGPLR